MLEFEDFQKMAYTIMGINVKKSKKDGDNSKDQNYLALKSIGVYDQAIIENSNTPVSDFRGDWLALIRLLYKEIFFKGDKFRFNMNSRDVYKVIELGKQYTEEEIAFHTKEIGHNCNEGVSVLANAMVSALFYNFEEVQNPEKNLKVKIPSYECKQL